MSDKQKSKTNSASIPEHPQDPRKDAINKWAFETYARDWAIRQGFFPVFQSCHNHVLLVKLYYDAALISYIRQLTEFIGAFYYEKLNNLSFSWIYFERHEIKNRIPASEVLKCKSIYELEDLYQDAYNSGNYPVSSEGLNMIYVDKQFDYLNDLINDGYLDAGNEKKCREEGNPLTFTSFPRINGVRLYVQLKRYTIIENKDGTYAVERIQGRGIKQPEVMTAEEIDALYYEHVAKRLATEHGFVIHFISSDGLTIYIKLITDPRYKGQPFRDAKFGSYFLRSEFAALSGSSQFTAYHYKTNGIVGYRIPENATPEEIARLEAERLQTYADLPDRPTQIIHGLAKPI